jgi:hypothetical protein
MVVVENALDRDFCEQVVGEYLARIGVDEEQRTTWPQGWHNLPATTAYPLEQVAPTAAEALFELVGPPQSLKFYGIPDNLIINFPDPEAAWWPPEAKDAHLAGWHKDGDWFRHFLDSPEQGMLGIVFWRDVTERQGATYVLSDSIEPVARVLAAHPEGLDPPLDLDEIVRACKHPRELTGRQGTIIWAHPFLLHSASVNSADRLRVISNTSVMLNHPLCFERGHDHAPLERSILTALGRDWLSWAPTSPRTRVASKRERSWSSQEVS